ncbi:hypothetical protein P691DRAFT_678258, partial [Macrolepiota fuliginosa MF-IS2]
LISTVVLERLEPYTMPDAAMDSSARDPPPKCHPGTRLNIGAKLEAWLDAPEEEWNMMWLHGPAGTGKSAVAQTFAEHCSERGRLGAAFFFSRTNNRNEPKTVIPTIAYQLAVHCRSYSTILADQLAGDPQLLKKAPRVQFKQLIVNPFLELQSHKQWRIQKPFLVLLDGLDECEGERAQFEFLNMINEAAQLENLPLLWLICSRPEDHLQYAFSRVAYCGRQELVFDDECRDDVDRYLRDELERIRDEFRVVSPSPWPSEAQFHELSGSVSGLFVFASTSLKYVGDPTDGNPVGRLKELLSFLKHAEAIGTSNPLAALDLLYAQILNDVSKEVFPITWRILAHHIYTSSRFQKMPSAQILCNFLHLDQITFYSALRKLHSVVAIPAPEDASNTPLRFHHASFGDFLSDPNRSGRFTVEEKKAGVDLAKSCLFWHNFDVTHFHTNDGWKFDINHRHMGLPGLKWISPDNEKDISRIIADVVKQSWDVFDYLSDERDDDLLSLVHNLDFRYMCNDFFLSLANWVHEQYPSDPIVRTTPSDELDMRLLEYMRTVIGQGPVDPATFPVGYWVSEYFCKWNHSLKDTLKMFDLPGRRRVYFFIGHGEKTTIVWLAQCRRLGAVYALALDKEPSLQQIEQHRVWLNEVQWGEAPDWNSEEESLDEDDQGWWYGSN